MRMNLHPGRDLETPLDVELEPIVLETGRMICTECGADQVRDLTSYPPEPGTHHCATCGGRNFVYLES